MDRAARIVIAAAFLGSAAGCAARPTVRVGSPAPVTLTILVTGVIPGGGPVRCGIYAERERFLRPGGLLAGESADPTGVTAEFTFEIVEPATVAISVFQDQDRDGDLDRGWLGIPSEPWGFSGTPAALGPPTWDACAISLRPGTNRVEIALAGGDRTRGG